MMDHRAYREGLAELRALLAPGLPSFSSREGARVRELFNILGDFEATLPATAPRPALAVAISVARGVDAAIAAIDAVLGNETQAAN